jgi:hypothetical protein
VRDEDRVLGLQERLDLGSQRRTLRIGEDHRDRVGRRLYWCGAWL